jgi:simple sugar transport system ATP-binding protein
MMPDELVEAEPLLRITGITKQFPDVLANDSVSIDVMPGEIHCLLGENGAGKTTLADMVYGVFRPDKGSISLKGQPLNLRSPKEAMQAGIGMVHQHFELVLPMSAVENVVIGMDDDLQKTRTRLEELCSRYDVALDLDAETGRLSVGEQQWVEILKALYVGVDLLILDEPTAVLTPQGVERLFGFLREMKEAGLAVIFITHKLYEVMEISDRVSVLRRGKLVATVDTKNTDSRELARLMVGRDVVLTVEKAPADPGEPLLEVERIAAEGLSMRGAVRDVSLTVHQGEILGLAGVSGNGQSALFNALVGLNPPTGGSVRVGGVETTHLSPKQIANLGLAGVPSDRIHQGLVMDFQIQENLVLGRQRSADFSRAGLIRSRAMRAFADHAIEQFEIMTPSAQQRTRLLSGGNLQKVILARELTGIPPKILLVHQPTRGLDIGASEYVRRRLVEERDRGAGVLLISEDLDEIFNLSDRIAVIYEGRIIDTVDPISTNRAQIGMLMAGIKESEEERGEL